MTVVATTGQYANQTFAINKASGPARYAAPLQKHLYYSNLSKGGVGWNVTFPRYQPRCGRASVTVVATTGQYANQTFAINKAYVPAS